jgi:hypothetical protein
MKRIEKRALILKMEALPSSDILVYVYPSTWLHIPEAVIIIVTAVENLKSKTL